MAMNTETKVAETTIAETTILEISRKPAQSTDKDPRWQAIVQRDKQSDGQFYYSVKTTGVYCRPSCGARLAKPENVQFHLTTSEAEKAGFRPCLRCKPDQAPPAEQNTGFDPGGEKRQGRVRHIAW